MRAILFAALLGAAAAAPAQPLRFDHLSMEQGLSESMVLAVTQDEPGFMWFGREVASLVSEELRPGIYQARWDAAGGPGGVCYCRLESVGRSFTRRLMLVK